MRIDAKSGAPASIREVKGMRAIREFQAVILMLHFACFNSTYK
jgi:hypothetical protein